LRTYTLRAGRRPGVSRANRVDELDLVGEYLKALGEGFLEGKAPCQIQWMTSNALRLWLKRIGA
jgi:hypothetical protein